MQDSRKVSVYGVIVLSFLFLTTLIFLPFGEQAIAADKAITWRCQASIAQSSPTYEQSVIRVAEKIKDRTNGRLIIETYPAGAVLPNNEIFPAVKRGMIEMGYATPGYWKSDLPLALVCALPYAFTNYWEVEYFHKVLGFEKMLSDQVAKHGVLYFGDHAIPVEIVTKEPIRTFDDFKGKKIRTYGQFGKFFNALGAQAVSAPGPEIYTGLATGVFQGAHWGAAVGAQSLALYEVCKYHMKPSISIGTEEGWYINKKALEKLPEDIQAVVKNVLDEQFWVRSTEYAYNEAKTIGEVQNKQGVQIITLSPEDQKKMAKIAVTIWDEIAKEDPENAKAIAMLKQFLRDVGRLE
ncbi:MAG TPA: TRAP transporter substrate-binding protein DctP [Syntrophales bacterium]|nr:TRAP transporter substrate-binding protein DctP [Syntrophales bacterium]